MGQESKVKVNLSELMWQHRIKSIQQLHEKTNLSRPTLSKLYRNDANYRFDARTLVTLCDFFGCSLTDLIEYDPHESEEKKDGVV